MVNPQAVFSLFLSPDLHGETYDHNATNYEESAKEDIITCAYLVIEELDAIGKCGEDRDNQKEQANILRLSHRCFKHCFSFLLREPDRFF